VRFEFAYEECRSGEKSSPVGAAARSAYKGKQNGMDVSHCFAFDNKTDVDDEQRNGFSRTSVMAANVCRAHACIREDRRIRLLDRPQGLGILHNIIHDQLL
jgi:hypothetical protein